MQDRMTFFHTDSIERLTLEALEAEARRRGFRTEFCDSIHAPAEIGVYCSHRPDPKRAKFSVVMLHDLGQRHDVWPRFWSHEPWTAFDVGLIPGKRWADLFLEAKRINRWLAPRYGIFEVGWPKADHCFDPEGPFRSEVDALRRSLALSDGKKTVLYAPSWENDNKQDEFVAAALAVDCNIVVKQADWPRATYPRIARNVAEMAAKYAGHPRVKTIDPKVSIMYALALADVIVSDESSVMVEALLFGVPAVAVADWTIPDRSPPRLASVPFEFVLKTDKGSLSAAIRHVLEVGHTVEYRGRRLSLKDYADLWFSRRGGSAALALDVVQDVLAGREPHEDNICARIGYDGEDERFPHSSITRAKARLEARVYGRLPSLRSLARHLLDA